MIVLVMTLRLKNTSAVHKLFGSAGGFGAFANNAIIQNNPHLLSILASKKTRISFKKNIPLKSLRLNTRDNKRKAKHLSRDSTSSENTPINSQPQPQAALPSSFLESSYASYKWISGSKARYYNIYLQPTLFGQYSVTKSWGGLHNHLGHYQTLLFDSLKEAEEAIDQICIERRSKRYQLCNESLSNK